MADEENPDSAPTQLTPITAIALDGRVDVARAATKLGWPELRRYSYGSIFDADVPGRLYLFEFGAVVHDGVENLDRSILRVIEAAVERSCLHDTIETYYVTVDPARASQSPRVGWDRVVIPERSQELLNAVALLLGQSAAIERYEKASEELIGEVLPLSRRLASRGNLPRATSTQLRHIGRVASARLELASLFYLFDRPEETWEDANVASLYDALFTNLELGDRHQAMRQKLQAVEEVTDLVINVWHARASNRLEWAIVLLIILEIVLAVLKVF